MGELLILNGMVITMDGDKRIFKNGGVAINDDKIAEVGKNDEIQKKYSTETIIDARNKLVLPGLVNCHTHVGLTICRGTCEDHPSSLWDIMMPIMEFATKEDLYKTGMLGCLELIRFGSTTIAENSESASKAAHAIQEVGLRGVVSELINDIDIHTLKKSHKYEFLPERGEKRLKDNVKLIKEWDGKADGRIQCIFGPQAADWCSEGILCKVREYADKYRKSITIHLGQDLKEIQRIRDLYNKTPFQYLQDIGLLGSDVLAAHCYHITDEDIGILKDMDTKVSHNPGINTKRGAAAPLLKFLKKGITVGLGTDNFYGDMIENMKLAIVTARLIGFQGTEPKPMRVLEMATIGGARALGMEKEIGSLEPGKKADIIIVDMRKPHLMPIINPIANLIHSGNGNDVETVIIDGRIIEQGRVIKTVDEEKVLSQAQEASDKIWQKFIEEHGEIPKESSMI